MHFGIRNFCLLVTVKVVSDGLCMHNFLCINLCICIIKIHKPFEPHILWPQILYTNDLCIICVFHAQMKFMYKHKPSDRLQICDIYVYFVYVLYICVFMKFTHTQISYEYTNGFDSSIQIFNILKFARWISKSDKHIKSYFLHSTFCDRIKTNLT